MKELALGCVAILLLSGAAFAQSTIDATGEADGKTVLWFAGTHVTALIESGFSVDGSLDIDGQTVEFTATGTATGEGEGDSSALTLDVWLLFDATGETAEGVPIVLRGGMAGSSDDADLASSAFGSASGPFFFLIRLGPRTYSALGTAEGSAAGAFVVPDDPLTMQMEGVGSYSLLGELLPRDSVPDAAHDVEPDLPWDPASWPAELYDNLIGLLIGTCDEAADGAEDV